MDVTKISKRQLRTLLKGAVIELKINGIYNLGYFSHTDRTNVYMINKRNDTDKPKELDLINPEPYPLKIVEDIQVYYS